MCQPGWLALLAAASRLPARTPGLITSGSVLTRPSSPREGSSHRKAAVTPRRGGVCVMKLFRGAAALLLVTVLLSLRPAPALTANAIQLENAKPGTTEWKITNPGYTSSAIEGYASLTSVDRGS